MGLFKRKQQQQAPASVDEAVLAADEVFNEQFREELRQAGRKHFMKLIDVSTDSLKADIEAMMQQVTTDAKEYMTKQLEVTVGRISAEATSHLNERVNEYNRVATKAQELAIQSLNRNTQIIHEKYQQMSASLQQTIASQEVMMVTVFQENKAQVATMQNEQEKAMQSLKESAAIARTRAEQLSQVLRQNASAQATRLNAIYQENMERVSSTRDAQAASIDSLTRTTEALEQQYQQLKQLLEQSISEQKERVTQLINDNMAQIVEHYVVGALGEQSNVRAQLPAIMQYLEENKEAMVEDMRL